MTITIDIAPKTTQVEVKGYGKFAVRPLGAGEELEINRIHRELIAFNAEIDTLRPLVDAEKEGTASKEEIEEGLGKVAKISEKIQELSDQHLAIIRRTFSGKASEIDKLFNELSGAQLMDIYRRANEEKIEEGDGN